MNLNYLRAYAAYASHWRRAAARHAPHIAVQAGDYRTTAVGYPGVRCMRGAF